MPQVRITKEFGFESAHALWNYDGKCKNIHGHSYKLFVTLMGEPITDLQNPKCGMVMDFGDLKKIVNELIIDRFDHAIVLNAKNPNLDFLAKFPMFEQHLLLDYQPTCENMVVDFAQQIQKKLPENLKLVSIKLYETATSCAEWRAEDN